MFFRYKRKRRL